jgi:hypothetical protein
MEGEIWGIPSGSAALPWICTFFDRPGGARGIMAFKGWRAWEQYEEMYQNEPDASLGDFAPYLLDGLIAIWNPQDGWPEQGDRNPHFFRLKWAHVPVEPSESELKSLQRILHILARLPEEDEEDSGQFITVAYRPSIPFVVRSGGKGPVSLTTAMRPNPSGEGFWNPVHKVLLRSRFASMPRRTGENWIVELFPFPKTDSSKGEATTHPVIGVVVDGNSGRLIRSFRLKPNKTFGSQLEEHLTQIWIDRQVLPERLLANSYVAYGWFAPLAREANLPIDREGPSQLIAELKDKLFFTLSI